MIHAVVIEDNPGDREILETLLAKYCSEWVTVAGTANNADDGEKIINKLSPDLVFLDVELGSSTGFDLLERLPGFRGKLIFVSGYGHYALRAIKFSAVDYILKPIDGNELLNAVKKAASISDLEIVDRIKMLVQSVKHPGRQVNRIALPMLNGYSMITVSDILYCEASRDYTLIHIAGQKAVCSCVNLGEYEELLAGYGFCRVHHSYIVNREHVKQYIKGEGGELAMINNAIIPVSRRKKTEVLEWLTRISN
jgi:two-component system, LytTR family, response regulator